MSTGNVHYSAPTTTAYNSPPITIILTAIILAFFFIGFFSLYICRCLMQNLVWTWHMRHGPNGTHVGPSVPPNLLGLDPKIIQSFPTFIYSSVKDYRKEKYGLECAICLVEFGNDDVLRLLTSCCHVFHQECIDLWLESHNTCPVCRRSLDSTAEASPEKSSAIHERSETTSTAVDESYVVVSIKDDNEDDQKSERHYQSTELIDQGQYGKKVFTRSHSTGHSVVVKTVKEEDYERFTLKLPEHVKTKIVKGHNPTRSCISFGDHKNGRTTESGCFGNIPRIPRGVDPINRV